jgi:7-carboxy-7-deazaguanine synthase
MIKINHQPIEKADRSDDGSLMIHSLFFTIQGEGPNVGKRAVFLRLAGCNLQCPGCDTEYTDGAFRESVESISTRIRSAHLAYTTKPCLVVITGGEPLRQNILPLVNSLIAEGYPVQIETNGTLGLSLSHVQAKTFRELQIVCSPKAGKVHESLYMFITAYKYVVNWGEIDPGDGLPTSVLGMPNAPARPHAGFEGTVYVQPADEDRQKHAQVNNAQNLKAAVRSVQTFGHTLCLQTHKIIGVE